VAGAAGALPIQNDGNPKGRPRGSRHRLSEAFLAELAADFEAGGRAAIAAAYMRVVASLLLKQEIERLNPFEQWTDEELDQLDAILTALRTGQGGGDRQDVPDIFFLPHHSAREPES
jgi:hypothetical protein